MFPVVLLQITAVSNSHSIRSVEYSYSDYFYNRQHQSEKFYKSLSHVLKITSYLYVCVFTDVTQQARSRTFVDSATRLSASRLTWSHTVESMPGSSHLPATRAPGRFSASSTFDVTCTPSTALKLTTNDQRRRRILLAGGPVWGVWYWYR